MRDLLFNEIVRIVPKKQRRRKTNTLGNIRRVKKEEHNNFQITEYYD